MFSDDLSEPLLGLLTGLLTPAPFLGHEVTPHPVQGFTQRADDVPTSMKRISAATSLVCEK